MFFFRDTYYFAPRSHLELVFFFNIIFYEHKISFSLTRLHFIYDEFRCAQDEETLV